MCNAFSCIIGKDKKVWWEFGIDSHEKMIEKAGYKDNTKDPEKIQFARVEISPANEDYLDPDRWRFKIDMDIKPAWWTEDHGKKCWGAFQDWKKELDKILPHGQKIVHPFRDISPVLEVSDEHLRLLREWASVVASVRNSVRDSVRASVGDSVRDSVGDSVRAYIGSFFQLPRTAWKHTKEISGTGYPFQPAANLWKAGLVPSFDGKIWRLHTGPDGHVVWKGDLNQPGWGGNTPKE